MLELLLCVLGTFISLFIFVIIFLEIWHSQVYFFLHKVFIWDISGASADSFYRALIFFMLLFYPCYMNYPLMCDTIPDDSDYVIDYSPFVVEDPDVARLGEIVDHYYSPKAPKPLTRPVPEDFKPLCACLIKANLDLDKLYTLWYKDPVNKKIITMPLFVFVCDMVLANPKMSFDDVILKIYQIGEEIANVKKDNPSRLTSQIEIKNLNLDFCYFAMFASAFKHGYYSPEVHNLCYQFYCIKEFDLGISYDDFITRIHINVCAHKAKLSLESFTIVTYYHAKLCLSCKDLF